CATCLSKIFFLFSLLFFSFSNFFRWCIFSNFYVRYGFIFIILSNIFNNVVWSVFCYWCFRCVIFIFWCNNYSVFFRSFFVRCFFVRCFFFRSFFFRCIFFRCIFFRCISYWVLDCWIVNYWVTIFIYNRLIYNWFIVFTTAIVSDFNCVHDVICIFINDFNNDWSAVWFFFFNNN